VAGVWLGNDDGQPMNQVTGGGLPARLWKSFMAEAHRGVPARTLPSGGSGFDLDSFIDSLLGAAPAAGGRASPSGRQMPNPSSTDTPHDPLNRPGAPSLN
jgi:penicillin-binding protein 1A